jgi:serine/threonine protein kinase
VYLAFSSGGRPVAVKVVRPGLGDDFRRRFRRETQAARQVRGMYTAQVLDADPDATPPWMVTAYVPGPSLREVVERHGPMPAQTVFILIAGVAEALLEIHRAGLVHRDLKPSNVLLAPDGPRVIDFGIARTLEATTLTLSNMRVGTPLFMAPEHVTGRPVTPAMDVFSLGAVATYAATGRSPFLQGSPAAVLYRIVHAPPNLEGCPAGLRDLIERCLAKDPAARPAPTDIMDICLARTADQPAQTAQAWLPPAMAATVVRYAAPGSPAERGPSVS